MAVAQSSSGRVAIPGQSLMSMNVLSVAVMCLMRCMCDVLYTIESYRARAVAVFIIKSLTKPRPILYSFGLVLYALTSVPTSIQSSTSVLLVAVWLCNGNKW